MRPPPKGSQAPLPGQTLYFSNNGALDQSKIAKCTSSFQKHIERNEGLYILPQMERDQYFLMDFTAVMNDEEFLADWPSFKTDLISATEFTLNCTGLGVHRYISSRLGDDVTVPLIRPRIVNYGPVQQLKDVNVESFGKFVSLRATVIKASPVEVLCDFMAFQCQACGALQTHKQQNGCYAPLTKCDSCGGVLEAAYRSPKTTTINWQSIVLQDSNVNMARIPQTLKCDLTGDLVKSCLPGDDVTISGVVKARDPEGKNKQQSVFNMYLEALSVYNNTRESDGRSCETISFTQEDYAAIREIHGRPNLFRLLVHSLCPSIFGHETVKAGLLLGLFKGTKTPSARSESHVLMVGDPGLGKSQMLKSCANVSPRGVYVCGNNSTTSGLTVTMTRESEGEYSLEAGALMIADQGCCCIDEFDKMPMQHACLLEAMEQQSISIAKAGVICSLPTKPSILVAANPVGGHYDKGKTVAENLKIGTPMLSRFDLIFILLDRPNERLDKRLSRHILSAHSSRTVRYTPKEFQEDPEDQGDSLSNRLKLNGEAVDHLPHKAFRKYIAYAQKYVSPQLTEGAKAVLKGFYVSLRREFATGDTTPVTARQLHSLIRLTQARAKAELREEATEEDATDVIEIMRCSLKDVMTNELGVLDVTRSVMGSGMSYKNQVTRLLDLLQRRSEIESRALFKLAEIKEAAESLGIPKGKFSTTLQSLNVQGFLLFKGRDTYQLNSAYL